MVLTELMRMQLYQVAIMLCGGIALGCLYDIKGWIYPKETGVGGWVCEIIFWMLASYLTFEFLYYCAYGDLSFHSFCALAVGVLLWRKLFRGTIT